MEDAPADAAASGRRTHTRGTEPVAAAHSAALDRLRAIRSGARSAAPVQVRMEDPIHDSVAEEEYASLVARRRTRTRGTEEVAALRSATLERLRVGARSAELERVCAIRVGARSAAAVQVRMEDQIYDTVAEEGFADLVARRRKDAGAFIIDEDGREEDWTHRALPSFSDEGSRVEDGAQRKRKQPHSSQAKRPPQQKVVADLKPVFNAILGRRLDCWRSVDPNPCVWLGGRLFRIRHGHNSIVVLFVVFNGHGGKNATEIIAENMPKFMAEEMKKWTAVTVQKLRGL